MAGLRHPRKAPIFPLTHGWVRHAVVIIAVKLSRLATLKEELDYFKTVSVIDGSVVTLHAKVLEHELGSLF